MIKQLADIEVYNVTYPAEVLHEIIGVSEDGKITGLTTIDDFIGLYELPEIPPCYLIGYGQETYYLIGGPPGADSQPCGLLKLCLSSAITLFRLPRDLHPGLDSNHLTTQT